MGFFGDMFKGKPKSKELGEEVDKLLNYVISLLKDQESIKKQVSKISEIKKLPAEKRELSYLSIYLNLEKALITQRPVEEQETFSSKFLRGGKEYTRESIREEVKKKIKINRLSDKIRVLFLDDTRQKLLLYEIMCQELVKGAANAKIQIKITSDNFLRGVNLEGNDLDFTSVNNRLMKSGKINPDKLRVAFSNLFLMIYGQIKKSRGKDLADEIVKRIYDFVQDYGPPINLAGTKILPIKLEEASIIAAREVIEYLTSLIPGKDLIHPQLEKLKKAETLSIKDKERAYFAVYLELENFIITHLPPAVKKRLNKEKLIVEIRKNVYIRDLEHRFKLLLLEEKEQIAELLLVFTEQLLTKLASVLELGDLQKFIKIKTQGTFIEGMEVGKENINLKTVEIKLSNLPKNKLDDAISDFSDFFSSLYKETKVVLGDVEAKNLVTQIYNEMKEQYGILPVFNEFLRKIPGIILKREKVTSLGRTAAEEIVAYLIELLKKEKIVEQQQKFEKAKTLPPEEQPTAFFNIYLELIQHITKYSPRIKGKPITILGIKEDIRGKVRIEDLEDKFQLLFLRQEELLIKLVKELVKECATNFIDKNAIINAEKELIKQERLLKDVTIDEDGEFNFKPIHANLRKIKARVKTLESTLQKIIKTVFNAAKGILGEIQAKRLFETSYGNLQKKYGLNLLQVLKVVPKGVLEVERYELLGKEQLQKTATELTKVETLKGEFMNLAAHELKTPLTPIIGYLEMILDDKKLNPDHRRKLQICLDSARRELDLVMDILDISKLESGTMKLELDKLDTVEFLKEATAGFEVAAEQKKIYLKTIMPPKLSPIKGDKRRLMQVIGNLITNATKFTEKGGITVKAEERDNDILISVSDTGMGLSQKNVKKLFTKFFQAGDVARRKHGGTGLGLAISKGIVESHKGKMWVKSELGKGTTFYFAIPIMSKEEGIVKKGKEVVKTKGKSKIKVKKKS